MEVPTAKAVEKTLKKTREEKLREQKIESEILKSLNGISEPDLKFQTLLHRCVEAERVNRSAQLQTKQNQKTIENLLSEKDNISADHQRVLLTRSKLESLCRELQSQNKTIKVKYERTFKINFQDTKTCMMIELFRKIHCPRFVKRKSVAKKLKLSSNIHSMKSKS